MAGVIPQKRDIPKKHHGARRQDNQSVAGIQGRNSQLPVVTVRKAVNAGWAGDWSELTKSEEVNPWVMTKLRESYYQEDDQRKGIVQKVMQKSTDFLGRIIAPVEGQGGSHCPTCALIAADTRMKVTSGAFRWSTVTVARRRTANRALVTQDGRCFGPTLHLRVRARISCVLSNCWPFCMRAEQTWWTRSSKVCRNRAG